MWFENALPVLPLHLVTNDFRNLLAADLATAIKIEDIKCRLDILIGKQLLSVNRNDLPLRILNFARIIQVNLVEDFLSLRDDFRFVHIIVNAQICTNKRILVNDAKVFSIKLLKWLAKFVLLFLSRQEADHLRDNRRL